MTAINMTDAKKMILACYKANEPLFLLGEPGMGKSSLFLSVTQEEGIGYIPNILSQKDPVDVGGMRVPDIATGILKHYPPEDLPVIRLKGKSHHPDRGILHYDELNVVSMLMQATAYGIINERRVGLLRLMEGWVPMASGNNVTDRSAAQRISLALANRFNVQTVVPQLAAWLEMYGSEHVDTRGCAYLRFRPEFFHVMPGTRDASGAEIVPKDEIRYPSARSWTKAFKFIDLPPDLRRKMIAGYVGDTIADDFEAFWRIMENATTLSEILANPSTARIPSNQDAGTYYAVAGMLARLMDRKNIEPIMTYVDQMLKDYQVALVQDATRRDPTLKNTAAYGRWAVKHQDATL